MQLLEATNECVAEGGPARYSGSEGDFSLMQESSELALRREASEGADARLMLLSSSASVEAVPPERPRGEALSAPLLPLFSVCQRFFTELSVLPPRHLAICAPSVG